MINSMARSLVTAKKWYRNISAGNPQYSEMELISTTLMTGNTANVQMQAIPQGYKHLQLRYTLRDSGAFASRGVFMEFNGNTVGGSNSQHQLKGNGSSVSSSANTNYSRFDWGEIPAANGTSNSFGVGIIDILDYTSTSKNKTVRVFHGMHQSDVFQVNLYSAMWNSTSAINWITMYTNNSMVAGSRVSLYGIKG